MNTSNIHSTVDKKKLKLEKISDTLKVYQSDGVFSYGTDAVLLASYAASAVLGANGKTCFDLCSGTGIIGLMLADKLKGLKVNAVEINPEAVEISRMSAEQSGLSQYYSVKCCDIKDIKMHYEAESAAFIVCNPPYMTSDCGKMCDTDGRNIARHEILCNLGDVFSAAYYLLKTGGRIFIVYRPDRLSNLFSMAKKHGFEIKRLTNVSSKFGKAPNLVLCEAKKQAKEGLVVGKNFYISNADGSFTPEMLEVREKGVFKFD